MDDKILNAYLEELDEQTKTAKYWQVLIILLCVFIVIDGVGFTIFC